jgi:hypothetical protein
MSNDLPTLDPDMLQTVSGGAKSSQEDIKLAMTQIKDSLSTLKTSFTKSSSSGDPTQMMMIMMMMKNR